MQTKFSKLLLYCQLWDGDKDQMMDLLRLFADLEPVKTDNADIIVFPRIGTRIKDWSAVEYAGQKFNISHQFSKRQGAGWPVGPNAVAMDVLAHSYRLWEEGRFNYSAAMLVEADCVPLKKGWIEDLILEWESQDKLVLGHWDGSGTALRESHMNGNLLFHPSVVDRNRAMALGERIPRGGWDVVFWPILQPVATPSKLIFSDYHLNTRANPLHTCEELWKTRYHVHKDNPLVGVPLNPVYLHGTKGLKAINCVRSKLIA